MYSLGLIKLEFILGDNNTLSTNAQENVEDVLLLIKVTRIRARRKIIHKCFGSSSDLTKSN